MALEKYTVKDVTQHAVAAAFICAHHYSKSCAKTSVFRHGLFNESGTLVGVALYLPPTMQVCQSIDPLDPNAVIALSRLAVAPGVPKNACTFLMARSRKKIREDGRYYWLVSFADQGEGHTGAIYKADNWDKIKETRPTPRFVDGDGRIVHCKSTVNRDKQKMEALGYRMVGKFKKTCFLGRP